MEIVQLIIFNFEDSLRSFYDKKDIFKIDEGFVSTS